MAKQVESHPDLLEVDRQSVRALRQTMRKLGVVVAEVDSELRYVWIDNPHPDFDPAACVGKRDDELISAPEARQIMTLKRHVFKTRQPFSSVLAFKRSDGTKHYNLAAFPIVEQSRHIRSILTLGFETSLHNTGDSGKRSP